VREKSGRAYNWEMVGRTLLGSALADWPRWAVSVSRRNMTRREARVAPVGQCRRGWVAGEVWGAEVVGMLGVRPTSPRLPGVRRCASSQSTGDRGR
jgi:hypothetical protein